MNYLKTPENCADYIDSQKQIPVDTDKLQVLLSAREYKTRILELIRSSTLRIYIVALYLQDDEAGQKVLDTLFQAKQARPDMDIKVFVDFHRAQRALIGHSNANGNVDLYKSMGRKYEHQIEILGVPVKRRELFGVLHLKGSVFDDTVLYTGASINNIYLHHDDRYRCDRYHLIESAELSETMVQYLSTHLEKSPAVQHLNSESIPGAATLKAKIKKFKQALNTAGYQFPHHPPKAGQIGITPLVGFGRRNNRLNTAIHYLMRSAREKVTLLTPYFNLPKVLTKEVKRLLRRNVEVNIITGDKCANDFFIPPDQPFDKIGALPYIYETNLKKFAKKHKKAVAREQLNIFVWKNGPHSFHLKGLYCDDTHNIITGNNLNPRAWRLDLENGLLIHDKEKLLKEIIESELSSILKDTLRLSSWEEIDAITGYPPEVRKFLTQIQRSKMDVLIRKIL